MFPSYYLEVRNAYQNKLPYPDRPAFVSFIYWLEEVVYPIMWVSVGIGFILLIYKFIKYINKQYKKRN